MPSVEPLPLVVATLTFLLAGFVKGVIGLPRPRNAMFDMCLPTFGTEAPDRNLSASGQDLAFCARMSRRGNWLFCASSVVR
jgi:hypothetical protein